MSIKTALALSAMLVIGATATAFAYEDVENKIGDRYPFLEQRYEPISTKGVTTKQVMVAHIKLPQPVNESVEDRVSDRYPQLEQPIPFVETEHKTAAKTTRPVKPFTVAEKKMFDLQSSRAVF